MRTEHYIDSNRIMIDFLYDLILEYFELSILLIENLKFKFKSIYL